MEEYIKAQHLERISVFKDEHEPSYPLFSVSSTPPGMRHQHYISVASVEV